MKTKYLTSQLDTIYAGKPWYGKNISESLADLKFEMVLKRIGDGHNLAELVSHMLTWRKYAIFVLQNGAHYEVEANENFRPITQITEEEWHGLLDEFAVQQSTLRALFNTVKSLDEAIPQKQYTYLDLLQGIMHHDIYHLGQINMLAKL